MSPEQRMAGRAGPIDARTMCLRSVRCSRMPAPGSPDIPDDIARIIRKALAMTPRPVATAVEFAAALPRPRRARATRRDQAPRAPSEGRDPGVAHRFARAHSPCSAPGARAGGEERGAPALRGDGAVRFGDATSRPMGIHRCRTRAAGDSAVAKCNPRSRTSSRDERAVGRARVDPAVRLRRRAAARQCLARRDTDHCTPPGARRITAWWIAKDGFVPATS